MVLMPSRTKYRKRQKGKCSHLATSGCFIEFGEFGMQSLGRGWITSQQIEACRVTISRCFSRKGKVWIRIFPDKPISKKPAETRMGKGKGSPSIWVNVTRPGKILFEVGNVSKEEARKALRLAAAKLPVKTRFVERVERV
ncbi:MAG: 50S ribosomal protein L16 [Candidatus Anoxychlamydiales bacterium]|nr:50S ribosomal protein L16 [Candidatus Anoxychlamydiales bacterium]NGX35341.1 50S ribosomal protein L16 [Candidatus Anoxychlamydiales bacterium]